MCYVLEVRASNPGGGVIFRTCQDRPWFPPSLLYSGYWVSYPEVKRPGRGVEYPTPSSAKFKEIRGADKSLARPGRKQATATEDFDVHRSYLLP